MSPTMRSATVAANIGRVDEFAALAGISLGTETSITRRSTECPILDFAASGAMWITGVADGSPVPIEAPVLTNVHTLCDAVATVSSMIGRRVEIDPSAVLTQRAAERAFVRGGQVSANRHCRMLPTADGWVACNLPREGDQPLLSALLGKAIPGDPWEALAKFCLRSRGRDVVEQAQLLGLAVAALDSGRSPGVPGPPALNLVKIGESSPSQRSDAARVVDFSAMWAGPLCAHILGRSGAHVTKIEDPGRPDGARAGDPVLYRRLHKGHALAPLSFSTHEGRRELVRIVRSADVVIESSRPRALAQLGLCPEEFLSERAGRSWISITGYGRDGDRSNYVAYGDDAAVSAGLVAWVDPDTPVFCADAVADPLGGLFAACGGLFSMAAGGGFLVDVSLSGAAAQVGEGPVCAIPHPVEREADGGWLVRHEGLTQRVLSPTEAVAAARV